MSSAPDEPGRRIVSAVHVAMLAAVPLSGGVLWLLRGHASLSGPAAHRRELPFVLLAVGAAEWLAATVVGRGLLRNSRAGAGAPDRVRRYFLFRFAAAEAMAVFGLLAGFTGARLPEAALLFCASAAALLASSPTRTAWERAWKLMQPQPP